MLSNTSIPMSIHLPRIGSAGLLLLALAGCKAADQPVPAFPTAAPVGVWEAASQRGVAFRAVGQEPGWLVEVDRGASPAMRAWLDNGQRELVVPAASRLADSGGFSGSTAKGEAVELRVSETACEDPMSGESFEATAQLHVDGQVLVGCGRFLPAAAGGR